MKLFLDVHSNAEMLDFGEPEASFVVADIPLPLAWEIQRVPEILTQSHLLTSADVEAYFAAFKPFRPIDGDVPPEECARTLMEQEDMRVDVPELEVLLGPSAIRSSFERKEKTGVYFKAIDHYSSVSYESEMIALPELGRAVNPRAVHLGEGFLGVHVSPGVSDEYVEAVREAIADYVPRDDPSMG